MNMEPLIPHSLLEDEDYQVFLELISIVHDDIKGMIAEFPELVDIDNAPEIFLPKLSALIRYRYRYDIDEDIQREIIKRIISIYRDRGTDDAISMAATYGDDPNWIGSHVFLPGANTNKDRAQVTHPVEEIFRHDISKHSGTHRYADAVRWRDGTLIIKTSKVNDDIRAAIKKVVPAGLKIYFDLINNSPGDGYYSELTFGEWVLSVDYELDYNMIIKDKLEVATFDVRGNGRRLRSGRQIMFVNYELEYGMGSSMIPTEDKPIDTNGRFGDADLKDMIKLEDSSGNIIYKKVGNLKDKDKIRITRDKTMLAYIMDLLIDDRIIIDNTKKENQVYGSNIIHPIDYNINGFELFRRHTGLPARSTSRSIRSGKYAFSGTYTGEIMMIARLEDVVPKDVWYPVSAILNLKPMDYFDRHYEMTDPTVDNKVCLGIKSVQFAKINSYYVETTDGLELIGTATHKVVVYALDGSTSEVDPTELSMDDQVKCYSAGVYLQNYTTPTEIITEVPVGTKKVGDIKLDTLVQTQYDTESINDAHSGIMVGSTAVDIMDLKLDDLVQVYSNKSIR